MKKVKYGMHWHLGNQTKGKEDMRNIEMSKLLKMHMILFLVQKKHGLQGLFQWLDDAEGAEPQGPQMKIFFQGQRRILTARVIL